MVSRSFRSPYLLHVDSPNFFTIDNAPYCPVHRTLAIFALAEVPVLILGEIDLSVGQMYICIAFFRDVLESTPVSPCCQASSSHCWYAACSG